MYRVEIVRDLLGEIAALFAAEADRAIVGRVIAVY
jgi:hypothetical protein